MLRIFIYSILLILFTRALAKFWRGFNEGISGSPRPRRAGVPLEGVQMARDPVCGTFVVPAKAVAVTLAGERICFCSEACRDQFMAMPGSRAGGRSR